MKELGPVAAAYREYCQAQERQAAAEELLHDPDLRELAQEELVRPGRRRSGCEEAEAAVAAQGPPGQPQRGDGAAGRRRR